MILSGLRIVFGCVYHIWYYILMLISICGLSPWLYSYSHKSSSFQKFYGFARLWSAWILNGMFLIRSVKYKAKIPWDRPYVIVANHTSELDVMYCYRLIKSPTVFIGKKELSKIPLFGFFFKRSSILVDRKSLKSKKNVLELSRQYLKRDIGVCVYPEGGIPKNENIILGKFKQGAFSLAIESGVDILPVTFANNRKYLPDFFKGGRPGIIQATVHEPINVAGMSKKDINLLSDKVHSLLLKELEIYRKKR